MPRPPRPITYRQAMAALQDTYFTILSILDTPQLPQSAHEQLLLLENRLADLLRRDDERR